MDEYKYKIVSSIDGWKVYKISINDTWIEPEFVASYHYNDEDQGGHGVYNLLTYLNLPVEIEDI